MELKTRVWTAGKLLLLAVALGATFLIAAAGGMRVALRTREVQVPNLATKSASDATAILAADGLALRVDDMRRIDPRIAEGHVLAQDPPAGSTARRPRTVRVWLSAGPRAGSVPALIGENDRVAELRVAQDGLTLGPVSEIRSSDYGTDVVVSQNPAPRTGGVEVTLLVNRGEGGTSYVMPDLIGVDGQRAADMLREKGFRVAVVGSTPYPGAPAGIVLRQSPQGGFQLAPGEPISLEVSR
jgi:serine/threonine-protein kinase